MTLKTTFGSSADKTGIQGDFVKELQKHFKQPDTITAVLDTLEKLELPVPLNKAQYVSGCEGALLFLNDAALVIRIEKSEDLVEDQVDRINNSRWVLRPLAEKEAGEAIIEICPGIGLMKHRCDYEELKETLDEHDIEFWDDDMRNTGVLPIGSDDFPEGHPVVMDRLAVRHRRCDVATLEKPIAEDDPQEILYAGLKQAFQDVWPEGNDAPTAGGMQRFYQACKKAKQDGILCVGWLEHRPNDRTQGFAENAANAYATLLEQKNATQKKQTLKTSAFLK